MTRKTDKGRRAIAAAQDNLQVGPIVHQAADRIGPLAQDAADRIGPLAHDAADRIGPLAHQAADRIAPLAQDAAERIAPLAQDAAERIAPLAHAATERIQPYAKQAADWLEPRAQDAAERLGPYAETARKKGAHAAAQAVDRLAPRLDDAASRIGPAVDEARERLQSDVLPKLSEKLGEIAGSDAPAAVVAAAGKGKELLPAGKKKRRWPKALAVVAGVLTAGGVAYYAAKKFLGGNTEPEWQTTRPTTPYAATTITEPKSPAAEPTVTESPAATPAAPAEAAAASASTAPSPDEVAPAHAADESTAEPEGDDGTKDAQGSKYGEGAYVGAEPPEGFTIKGNERSKKYHVTGTDGYERTNADVWFNSESAAETAGFTKAQR